MSRAAILVSLVFTVASAVACGGTDSSPSSNGSAATSPTCADFVVTDDDKVCTVATDCTFVAALRVCSGDPSCGGQVPMNRAGAARYGRETASIERTQASCGAPAPEACVKGRCVVCNNPADCPDGG
jgi:hypothetical protein